MTDSFLRPPQDGQRAYLTGQFTKLRAALSARLLQWRKIHASTGGQYRSSYEEGRDNMLMDCIEGLTADVQASFSQTEEDKRSMATAPGHSKKVEAVKEWLDEHKRGRWSAYDLYSLIRLIEAAPSPTDGASSLGDARTKLVANAGAAGQLRAHEPQLYAASDGPISGVNGSYTVAFVGCSCGWNSDGEAAKKQKWSEHIAEALSNVR